MERKTHKGFMFDESTPDTNCPHSKESDDIVMEWEKVTCKNCLNRRPAVSGKGE